MDKSKLKKIINHSVGVVKVTQSRSESDWNRLQSEYFTAVYNTATHLYNDEKSILPEGKGFVSYRELEEVYQVVFEPKAFLASKVSGVSNGEEI